jgi:osmoprotectant transport system substrate-binding protein
MLIVGACGPTSTPRGGAPDALHDDAITVASFDFPESRLLAEVYGAALERGGINVEFARDLGPRELGDPALARGLVELVPEYAGTALEFLSLGDAQPSADVVATHAALRRSLHGGNMVALAPAPAQTANAIVVTRTTATRHGLATISDLAAIAPDLTFGGPPECLHRPFCLEGLQNTYDLEFAEFLPLDTGGPLTLDALNDSVVDVALLFSTEPRIASDDLVELTDDRALQPAENGTPFVHRSAIRRFGPQLVGLIDAISATLTTAELRTLNGRVANGESPSAVAHDWVAERGRS